MSAPRKNRVRVAASVIAMTVATFGTSAAFADNEEPKEAPKAEAKADKAESAKPESAKTESAKTPAKKADKDAPKEAPKADAAKKSETKAEKTESPKADKAEPAKVEPPKSEPTKADAPKSEAAPATSSTESTLPVRPSKPLSLAPQNESTPWGYKLFAFVVIAGGIAFWLKKRKKIDPSVKKPAQLDIVARSSVGVRSELIVVEVEGTRLLVGMTPSAISTLAILDSGDPMMAREERATEPSPEPAQFISSTVTDRVKTLFGNTSAPPPARASIEPPTQRMTTKRAPHAPNAKVTKISARPARAPVAAQAKGLLLALEEDRAIER